MKNTKEHELTIKYYPCWEENTTYWGGTADGFNYERSIRMDLCTDLEDTNNKKLYIFGTQKGLYDLGKLLVSEGSWKCWYDHYHQHYYPIKNRYNIPLFYLTIRKIQGTNVKSKTQGPMVEKNVKLKLEYYNDQKDEKGNWHYGKVCPPKYTDEITIEYGFVETLDWSFDEPFVTGMIDVDLTASDRAMRELGKYLINVSMFKTKNKKYIGTIKNIASNGDSKISICVSKIWKTPAEIEKAHKSYKKYNSYHDDI